MQRYKDNLERHEHISKNFKKVVEKHDNYYIDDFGQLAKGNGEVVANFNQIYSYNLTCGRIPMIDGRYDKEQYNQLFKGLLLDKIEYQFYYVQKGVIYTFDSLELAKKSRDNKFNYQIRKFKELHPSLVKSGSYFKLLDDIEELRCMQIQRKIKE